MDLREKLIELIRNGVACPGHLDPFGDHCEACHYYDSKECEQEWLADHLIANGVTVQEWIPVTKETPTESDGTVWVCLADKFPYNHKEPYVNAKHDGRVTEAHYSEFSKRWDKDGALFPDGDVTHWMKKLEPPKES